MLWYIATDYSRIFIPFMSEVGIDHDPIWDKIRERIG